MPPAERSRISTSGPTIGSSCEIGIFRRNLAENTAVSIARRRICRVNSICHCIVTIITLQHGGTATSACGHGLHFSYTIDISLLSGYKLDTS